jgi:REP element-mobilizing transposase RayT
MARTLRPHQPGAAFHIVSRTQGHQHWFLPDMKREIEKYVVDGVASGGARLFAHAVMDNHIHVLLFQGSAPLGWVMQPILRRSALLVQRVHGVEGHVFERNFRVRQCESVEHVRNSILYIHRNPVVARMCQTAIDYEFSSARAYEGLVPCGSICVDDGLQVFGCGTSTSSNDLRIEYRMRLNREMPPDDVKFFDFFLPHRRRSTTLAITRWSEQSRRPATDIRDAALRIIKAIDPDAVIELVRSRYGGPKIVAIRHQVIASLLQRGYAGVEIASYLRVSAATVSKVRSRMRWASLEASLDSNWWQH